MKNVSATNRLEGKKVLLGITGGIAAYKSVELLRLLIKEGAEVRVVMTTNACEFISPLTFRALSGFPVITDIFSAETDSGIDHIALTDQADLFIIAPATANIIGKIAAGIGDDPLSTMVLAFEGPLFIAPSMNSKMYRNAVLQSNMDRLKSLNYNFVGPESGELACGLNNIGRMSEPAFILESVISSLGNGELHGKKVLVTAGPTREYIDPVRFISNRSSGKMGYAIAEEAVKRGAAVILISGPTSIDPPEGAEFIRVITSDEMHRAVMENVKGSDAVIMTAAVADYRADQIASSKLKKANGGIALNLQKTVDILGELGRNKNCGFLVGFAAETENLIDNASKKLKEKNLDLIVANDVSEEGAGFDVDTNRVYMIDNAGVIEETSLLPKKVIAAKILDIISNKSG